MGVRVCTIRYLRYGLLLGVAAGVLNVTVTVLLAVVDGSGPYSEGASFLPRLMLADYVGGMIAGLAVGLARGVYTAATGGNDSCPRRR